MKEDAMHRHFLRSTFSFVLALLLALACAIPLGQAQSQPDAAQVAYFYDALRPYGQWMKHSEYGWVWSPRNMPADWRPYGNDGHWEYTSAGWTWFSDLPWGWVCFHYGRWVFDDTLGWLWYPGTVWAPGWVAWRYNDDWVG